MARGLWHLRGGGGTTSDELTATRDDVLAGKTAVTSDSDDEAAAGTMPNNGAVSETLKAGDSYTIPKGYHNGKGKVAANSLASQTGGATAVDNKVVSGYKYWKDGVLRTGNLVINSVVSFSVAAYSVNQVTATWQWPWTGPYSGVAIQYKEGGYPTSIWDGVRAYTGTGNNAALGGWSSVIIGGLVPGHTYYFRIWVYCNTSDGDMVSSGYRDAICATTANGQQTLTSSGIWTVPNGVRTISVFLVGGGAGGTSGDGASGVVISGHGGGGGYTSNFWNIDVTPGQQIPYTIGGGGAGGAAEQMNGAGTPRPSLNAGGAGGNTIFGTYSANGAPINNYLYGGGKGGSGGGGGQRGWGNQRYHGGNGGSDGGDGGIGSTESGNSTSAGGKGQGSTTKPFGDVNGTSYSAGGGGGTNKESGVAGSGGHYGGGNGGRENASGGTPNSGSGGGGGGMAMYSRSYWGGNGGSGVIIVRW